MSLLTSEWGYHGPDDFYVSHPSKAVLTATKNDNVFEILEVVTPLKSRGLGCAKMLIDAALEEARSVQSEVVTGICSSQAGFGLLSTMFGAQNMYQWRMPGGNWQVEPGEIPIVDETLVGLIYPTEFAPENFDPLRPLSTAWENRQTPPRPQL